MAPPSPRRSSRARGPNSQSQQSSTSSSISSRAERNTRSLNKPSSSKSTPSASLSSEPPDDTEENRSTRRRNRGHDEDKDRATILDSVDMGNASDDIQEEDEAVRCICGFDDYPGPPPLDDDTKHPKDGQDSGFFPALELTDEAAGFFVQCDVCKVWQHGACVGIMTEESSPEEYFCEKCRKDLHKIHTAANGQRYSNYLPLNRHSRTTSRATSLAKDGTGKNRRASPAAAAKAASSKRRSTLNSREAGYDEDELLRRVIEESKHDAAPEPLDGTSRRAKRGRSGSEENQATVKRQRTSSRSTSPSRDKPPPATLDESDDGGAARNGSSKKPRNARHQREKSEREERERARQEAANKRKVRADRRRAEDSDPSEELPLATARAVGNKAAEPIHSVEPAAPSQPTPDTPPASSTAVGSSHKKSGRGNLKKSKGRNQYNKDPDGEQEESPARSMSRDPPRNDDSSIGGNTRTASDHSKQGSSRKGNAHSKMSMGDMKRRVAAFLDFISRTQVELAGEPGSGSSEQSSPGEETSNGLPKIHINGDSSTKNSGAAEGGIPSRSPSEGKDFRDMNCVEMMDTLARDLVKWQNTYAS